MILKLDYITGEELDRYDTLTEAALKNRLTVPGVRHACVYAYKGTRAGDYRWANIDKETDRNKYPPGVGQYKRAFPDDKEVHDTLSLCQINKLVKFNKDLARKISDEIYETRPRTIGLKCNKCLTGATINRYDNTDELKKEKNLIVQYNHLTNKIEFICGECGTSHEL